MFQGAGASNTNASAPPTALTDEQKPLDGTNNAPASDGTQPSLPPELETQKFTVSKEEADTLNAQVKTIKTKGVLNMWKNKTLV